MVTYNVGVVCLGRYGDCLNIMPCVRQLHLQGASVLWAIHPEFADILDGISYADRFVAPVPRYRDVHLAEMMIADRCAEILIPQLYGNEEYNGREQESFAVGMWNVFGMADRWHDLPLVLDRRDPARESKLCVGLDDRPLVLTCFNSSSSPFNGADIAAALRSRTDWNVVRLDAIRADRIYDLCGLMERAACLVTVDTAALHLSYATRVPTVALLSEGPPHMRSDWYGTHERRHWIGSCRYSRVTPEWVVKQVENACSVPS